MDRRQVLAAAGCAAGLLAMRMAAAGPRPDAEDRGRPLFNGRDLEGWEHVGGGSAVVRGRRVILEHDRERRPGYLVSRVPHAGDFTARFRCRVLEGDSGLLFRSRRHPLAPTEVMGPQVQLNRDPGRGLGGIFELHGRGWLIKPPADLERRLAEGDGWLTGELEVKGAFVRVRLNGIETARLADDQLAAGPGLFAWQIHGGGPCRIEIDSLLVSP